MSWPTRWNSFIVASLSVLVLSVACGKDSPTTPKQPEPPTPKQPEPPPPVTLVPTRVVITPSSVTLNIGDTLRLVAETLDQNDNAIDGTEFNWSSRNGFVATVDGSGLVRGIAEGTATITARSRGVLGTSVIKVAKNVDRTALVALYNATDGPNWVNNENWLTDAPLGDWSRVQTDASGFVVELNLDRGGLKGMIPPELGNLGNLSRLTRLKLNHNALTGSIPSELGNLTRLRSLNLANNALSGTIPPELGNLTMLSSLYLNSNEISGPIPVELARLPFYEGSVFFPGGVCVPEELRGWAVELRISVLPCSTGGQLLSSVLMRIDGNGVSLALPENLREPSALMVSDPGVVAASVTDGWIELVPRGLGSAEVEVVPSNGADPARARVVVREAVGTFGIDIVMDRPAPVTYESALTKAADFWSAELDGTEWPDRKPACFTNRATADADELLIHAWIDHDIEVAGYASTCFRDSGQQVALDPGGGAIIANPANTNFRLVQHEMGHILGLVLWGPETGLVTGDRTYFVGPRAVQAFRDSGGDADLPGVPISGVHWARDVGDIMDPSGSRYDWRISIAALADAGYTVD